MGLSVMFLEQQPSVQRWKCDWQHILSDPELHLFQSTKAMEFDSELTLYFSQSQEVWKMFPIKTVISPQQAIQLQA